MVSPTQRRLVLLRQLARTLAIVVGGGLLLANLIRPAVVDAGVYYIEMQPPAQTNVDSIFSVKLYASMVKDSAATGYVSGTVTYPTSLVKLINVRAVDYPKTTYSWTNGTLTVSSPSVGAGNGYNGGLTLFTAQFQALATGTATFAVSGGAMYVNGTNHVARSGATTIYAKSCPTGQVGTPPQCSTPPPVVIPAPTPVTPSPIAPVPATPTSPTTTTGSSTQTTSGSTSTTKTGSSSSSSKANTVSARPPVVAPPQTSGPSGITIAETGRTAGPTQMKLELATSAPVHDVTWKYGINKDSMDKSATPEQDGLALRVTMSGLTPSTVYYYEMSSKDSENKLSLYDAEFATGGFPVEIKLSGISGKLADRQVRINDITLTTDARGIVSAELPAGDFTITDVETGATQLISVQAQSPDTDGTYAPQSFELAITAAQIAGRHKSVLPAALGTIFVVVVAVAGFFGYRLWARRRRYNQAMAYTTGDDPYYAPMGISEQPMSLPSVPTDVAPGGQQSYPAVSLADMFTPKHESKVEERDPFLENSPFAPGRDLEHITKRIRGNHDPK